MDKGFIKKIIGNKFYVNSRAFTLVELMVVIAIASIIMTALVIQQNKWNDEIAVNTQAYELALFLRQAQMYSLAVRENVGTTGDRFNTSYGILVNIDNNSVGTTNYSFFADHNLNNVLNTGELIETKNLTRGVRIARFCGLNSSGTLQCSDNTPSNERKVSITFLRPHPNAYIKFLNQADGVVSSINPPVRIYLKSENGRESVVKVEANGQISIE